MRVWINKFGLPVAIGLLVMASAIYVFWGRNNKAGAMGGRRQMAYFVDEETLEEQVVPATEIPPLVGKSGKPTLCQGVFLTPDAGKTRKLAYLVKYSPEAKAALEAARSGDAPPGPAAEEPPLVRAPDGTHWYKASGPTGQQITAANPFGPSQAVTVATPP